jgi:hypothetical protein
MKQIGLIHGAGGNRFFNVKVRTVTGSYGENDCQSTGYILRSVKDFEADPRGRAGGSAADRLLKL